MQIDEQGSELIWRASELDKGLLCMRQLGYSRLGVAIPEGAQAVELPKTYSWALVGGLALDDTLSAYERSRMGHPNTPTNNALPDFYRDRMKTITDELSSKGTITSTGEEDTYNDLLHTGLALLPVYEEHSKSWQPVAVQLEASVKIDDITLVGHIDYIRDTGTNKIIGDWKFTKKTPGQMPARTYSRGWAYDLMAGDGSGAVELTYLRKGLKTPKIDSDSHFVTKAEHAQVARTVKTISRMYKARQFPMADANHWICNPKWCTFWSICRGNSAGPAPIPGEDCEDLPN